MDQILGACSLCGGPVVVPDHWMGTQPPVPQCRSCFAVKKQPYGHVIEMESLSQKYHNPKDCPSGFIGCQRCL